MVGASLSRIPEYARAGDDFRRAHRAGTEHALRGFLDILEGRTDRVAWRAAYRAIGAGEYRAGRSLQALHASIRVGARMGWRQLLGFAESESLPLPVLREVTDAIWTYVDDLVDAATEGYSQAGGAEAGELERRRLRLLDLLMADPPASDAAVLDAAALARWALPRRVAVVALERATAQASPPVLPPDVLVDLDRPEAVLLVPDPDSHGQIRMLVNTLRGHRAAIGPAVPTAAAGNSLRWARRALSLACRGIISAGDAPVWCQDHLALLTVYQDEMLLDCFIGQRLQPLERLRAAQRAVLAQTLLSYLQHNLNATAVGADLHLHPQTVRRRLRQLDNLFGDQVQDPLQRFELQVALWADQTRSAERRSDAPTAGPEVGVGAVPRAGVPGV
ncbi:MAG TPA: helix-turn-helix domain-containing protein [Rugosimonospora sp.]|nr:helix-turn-helix domain-containing protein [Rugosimonospora sp.]